MKIWFQAVVADRGQTRPIHEELKSITKAIELIDTINRSGATIISFTIVGMKK